MQESAHTKNTKRPCLQNYQFKHREQVPKHSYIKKHKCKTVGKYAPLSPVYSGKICTFITSVQWENMHLYHLCTVGKYAPLSPVYSGKICTFITSVQWENMHLYHLCTVGKYAPLSPVYSGKICTFITCVQWENMHLYHLCTVGKYAPLSPVSPQFHPAPSPPS